MELDIEFGEYVEHDKTTLKDYCENIYHTKYKDSLRKDVNRPREVYSNVKIAE